MGIEGLIDVMVNMAFNSISGWDQLYLGQFF